MPGDGFSARTRKSAPPADERGTDDDKGEHERPRGRHPAEPTHHSHATITGTPVALPASSSNCAGSVVNSPSRMVLLAPW